MVYFKIQFISLAFFLSSNFFIFPVEVFGSSQKTIFFGSLNPAKVSLQNFIISGGENISSIEIENAIAKHPSVSLAAVVAKPDEKWGETPCAFVELIKDKPATEKDIIDFCRETLAGFKLPKSVIFCDLPKTSTGKIQKFELRKKVKDQS